MAIPTWAWIGLMLAASPGSGQDESALEAITVFESGAEDYRVYRIPSLIVSTSGTLLAFCEGRKNGASDAGDIDLLLRRSTDGGRTWNPTQLVYEEGGDRPITIGNPCAVVDRETGAIWLSLTRNNDDVLITSSNDDGLTWAKPRRITSSVKPQSWTWYATGPGVGIQLQTGPHAGRLVIPCDHREVSQGRTAKFSHVFFSDDHGQRWELGGTVAIDTDECQVIERSDGILQINMRNYWGRDGGRADLDRRRATALSGDGGIHWQGLRFEETLIEPICQASLIRLDPVGQGDRFLFANPASPTTRHRLTVRLSPDGGESWTRSLRIHEGPAAYSCLARLPDRSIGCLYEAGERSPYESIRFVRIAPERLSEQ